MNLIALSALLVGALGLGMLIGGIVLMRSPAVFIVAGMGFLSWTYVVSRATDRRQRRQMVRG
ncbi:MULTISPECIES: hypothetical protein [Pseudomonas]|uniref:Uncharacterized protein n=1 Tax=Pseudomonas cichorii TaxID=36746 RepID=A0A3M3SUU9_PSECI|nr:MULTISPECIES: hypothetical protein [Pseudomonas]AHF67883.1 hypothetical protein PCH70_27300 [Pseudomonas cichorii JBC1]MBX8474173.1 hypothetical protein [Pseudomonas cichorii]MBX8612179.1 hypothetical protein [Pseudomonas cichorii]MCV4263429.1 hypothetical protein [Pseudomonas capsici]MCV4274623.1 hypothetical protein [Pseudomonas capsici]